MRKKWFRFVFGLLVGCGLIFAGTRFVDLAHALEEFQEFPWPLLGWVLPLSLGYYLCKAVRWHYFLRIIGIRLPLRRSVLLYLTGQWFAFTPAGEYVRAYLLTEYGYRFSEGSAAVTAQVLFDILSLAVVASIAVMWHHQMATVVLPFTLVLIVGIAVIVHGWRIRRWTRFPIGGVGGEGKVDGSSAWTTFYHDTRQILRWKSLIGGLSLGILAVVLGSYTLLVIASGFEIAADLGQASYVYSLSQLAGALSMLPHGLGAVEGSSVALFSYAGVDAAHAASTIVMFRLCTVGWGIVVGGISLVVLRTPLAGPAVLKKDPGHAG